jgi:hypothetical protein
MKITRKMVEPEYNALKARNLRMHDLCSIKAMHPDIKVRAAAIFLIRAEEVA